MRTSGVLAAVLAVIIMSIGSTSGSVSAAPAASATAVPIRLDLLPDGWRAPGAKTVVAGYARTRETVVLLAGGRRLATARAGRLGRFRLRFAAPAPGRYRLRVAGASGRSAAAGALVVRPLVLDAVGDITFGEQVGPAVLAHGYRYPWRHVAAVLRRADIATGNLETSISDRGLAVSGKLYTFRGPPEAAAGLAFAGLDVATLANNHSRDFGGDALVDTLRRVRSAGVATVGAGRDEAEALRPAVLERGGLRVAILGFSDVNPAGFTATPTSAGTARADPSAIAAAVEQARRRADVVVCFFHWGIELRAEPDARQRALAAACLNAGARLVLGAHPHVFGGLDRPADHALVAWTLGNFVFPSAGRAARTGVLRVLLDVHGVRAARVIPVRIDGFSPVVSGP
jgi:poly-gamma-glutamate synthesis protein (capsule biosynthesis protein)